jgi:hypothetical protein
MHGSSKFQLSVFCIYLIVLLDTFTASITPLNNFLLYPDVTFDLPYALNFINGTNIQIIALSLLLMNLIVPLMCFLNSDKQYLRIFNAAVFIISKGIIFSSSRFSHQYWPLIWILVFFAFPKSWHTKGQDEELKNLAYKGAVLGIVLFYFFPGFYKILEGVYSTEIFNLDYGSNQVASFLLLSSKKSFSGKFLVELPLISYLGMLFFVFIQVGAPLVFFSRRFFKLFPYLILFFHSINVFSMQINFLFSALVTIIIFQFAPENLFTKFYIKESIVS